MSQGKLLVCATPVGNLEDVTLRVLRVLNEVDVIVAEDTRVTKKLLNRYKIKTPLESYHEHNQVKKAKELVDRLERGLCVALVSDAGMPGLSDPGYKLIRACIDSDIDIEVLPGPFAGVAALVASGLPTDCFVFQGFLPRKRAQRTTRLRELSQEKGTLVFYESCHRIKDLLEDALEVLGERQIALARELTKRFEEIIRGDIGQVLAIVKERKLKGEIVLVVAGAPKHPAVPPSAVIRKKLQILMAKGISKKDATKQIAKEEKIPKRIVYEIARTLSTKVARKSRP